MPYWYNVDSGQVEDDETKSAGDHLMGPYDSQESARNALQSAREKTQKWDDDDREWNQRGTSS